MHEDDPGVQDEEILYRRISHAGDTNMLLVDEHTAHIEVRSSAFALDDDGCSVYLHSVLTVNALQPEHVAVAPQNVIVSVTVETVRRQRLGARPDPWPDLRDQDGEGDHPRHAAHALIVNPEGLGSKRLRASRRLIARSAVICVFPDPSTDPPRHASAS